MKNAVILIAFALAIIVGTAAEKRLKLVGPWFIPPVNGGAV